MASASDYATYARAYANLIWKGTKGYDDTGVAYNRVKTSNKYCSPNVTQNMLLDVYRERTINGCRCTKINFEIKTGIRYESAWNKYIVEAGYELVREA